MPHNDEVINDDLNHLSFHELHVSTFYNLNLNSFFLFAGLCLLHTMIAPNLAPVTLNTSIMCGRNQNIKRVESLIDGVVIKAWPQPSRPNTSVQAEEKLKWWVLVVMLVVLQRNFSPATIAHEAGHFVLKPPGWLCLNRLCPVRTVWHLVRGSPLSDCSYAWSHQWQQQPWQLKVLKSETQCSQVLLTSSQPADLISKTGWSSIEENYNSRLSGVKT